jgi:major structural subunit of bundle-forming pilus
MRNHKTAVRRRGFTLIELAMVLAIAALIIGSVMLFFGSASTNQKTNDVTQETANIAQIVRGLYSGQPDYSGITTASIASSSQMPNKWVSGNTLRNGFQGSVTVTPSGANNAQFAVSFSNLPDYACTKIATYDFGTGSYGVTAGTTTQYGSPLTPVAAEAACNGGSGNTLTFYLY